MARGATGGAAYNVNLEFPPRHAGNRGEHQLAGPRVESAAPLAKSAEAVLPLRYENALLLEAPSRGPAGPPRIARPADGRIGRLASAVYVRDMSGPEPRVLRGGIAVGLGPGQRSPCPNKA